MVVKWKIKMWSYYLYLIYPTYRTTPTLTHSLFFFPVDFSLSKSLFSIPLISSFFFFFCMWSINGTIDAQSDIKECFSLILSLSLSHSYHYFGFDFWLHWLYESQSKLWFSVTQQKFQLIVVPKLHKSD